jgi:hypothetical protein
MIRISSCFVIAVLASTSAYACKPAPSCWSDSGPEYVRGICKDYAKEHKSIAQITDDLKDEPGYADGDSLAFVKKCERLHVYLKSAEHDNNCFLNGRAPQWALDILRKGGHGANLDADGTELTLTSPAWKGAICNKREQSVTWK